MKQNGDMMEDDRTLQALVESHSAFVKFLRRHLDSEEVAEDILQQGLLYAVDASRLHRARQALKKSLIRTCGTCTEHHCLDCSCKGR